MPGYSNALETALLDHVFGSTPYTAPSSRNIKLHKGPPGDDGTLNAATETTRKVVTFGAATTPSGAGQIASNAQAQWTAFNTGGTGTTETMYGWSLWDNISAGTCLATGVLGGLAALACSAKASTDAFTSAAHGFANADRVEAYAIPGSSLPTGVSADTLYFIVGVTTDTFQISLTSGGAAVDITADGSCLIQKVIGKVINNGDTVTLASGQLTVYSD